MLAHLSFGVSDFDRAVAFYDAALAPLGVVRVWRVADGAGYGAPGGPDRLALKVRDGARAPGEGFHLAFAAPDRAAVDAFHAAALAAGGADNGAPGLRERYGPDYYAAFVVDPEGHRIEAVHSPGAAAHAITGRAG
jgi:catechol 2,3-dioxygenase-like lactoylglutathione lyase family enzyme